MGLRLAKEQIEIRSRGIGARVGSRGAGLRLAEPSAVARSSSRCPEAGGEDGTHGSRGGLLVAGLASDLEGNAVGGGVLELEGGGREVVEILVEEL